MLGLSSLPSCSAPPLTASRPTRAPTPPKTPKQTPAGDGKPSPTAGTIDSALSYQISRDVLSNVKDILKSLRPPKVTKRTKTGRRSAGS